MRTKLIEQENKLSSDQFNELISRKDKVLKQLDNKPVDYFPRVCWYYEELSDELNKFFDQINTDSINEEEIIRAKR
ncbi:Imm3 family immunity protein [Paenibacillus sp. USHLN196]|uniref:Imm3 family immunity protein n=1 Tax=Paenibacillus sp. USHLN196 TaxID=3081291 RepID=UPI00301B60FF